MLEGLVKYCRPNSLKTYTAILIVQSSCLKCWLKEDKSTRCVDLELFLSSMTLKLCCAYVKGLLLQKSAVDYWDIIKRSLLKTATVSFFQSCYLKRVEIDLIASWEVRLQMIWAVSVNPPVTQSLSVSPYWLDGSKHRSFSTVLDFHLWVMWLWRCKWTFSSLCENGLITLC